MNERALSKSQLEAWKSCQRKFGWSYLEGFRGTTDAAELGTRVHALLEQWLRHGVLPNGATVEGKIALAGIHHLPAPNTPGLLVEEEIFTITQQAWYHGFADWIEPGLSEPVIGDHKTTGDFKWALRPEDLKLDIQGNIYARAALKLYGTERAIGRWVYYRTKGAPKSLLVQSFFHRDEVEQVFAEIIDPLAAQIQKVRLEQVRVLDLEPNLRACSDYGGCPYRSNCNIDAKGRFKAMVAHEGLAAQMKARAAARQATTPAPAEQKINPPESKAAPKAATTPLKERLAAMAGKAQESAPVAPPVASTPSPAPKAAPAPEAKEKPSTAKRSTKSAAQTSAPGDFILCAGCLPLAPFVNATEWIDQAKRLLQSENGHPDYRLADFNKGPAELATVLRSVLADSPPSGYVFLDTRTAEGQHSFEAFREVAQLVIRGV